MAEWLSAKQAAQRYAISEKTLRYLVRKGALAVVRLPNGRIRYAMVELEALFTVATERVGTGA